MPCEACHVQFTVFRRKRCCCDCKRFYCSNCLSLSKRTPQVLLCRRCAIFAKRPLLKADLVHLKPKDLIFYLQSKHISTTGCVEKDELVGLVLNHAQQTDSNSANSNGPYSEADSTNSFDNIKQTCQNFFSNLTDNLSDSFPTFDAKAPKSRQDGNRHTQETTTNGPTHIFNQPRPTTREMPTYASFQNGETTLSPPSTSNVDTGTANCPAAPRPQDNLNFANANRPMSSSPSTQQTSSCSNESVSSVFSASPIVSYPPDHEDMVPTIATDSSELNADDEKSDCECSDDEIIASYSEKRAKDLLSSQDLEHAAGGPSTSSGAPGKSRSPSSKLNVGEGDESSQSSFEELGAIGGISDDSKGATDTNSNGEQWQVRIIDITEEPVESNIEVTEHQENPPENVPQLSWDQRMRRVIRRRSDSYLNRRQRTNEDDSPSTSGYNPHFCNFPTVREQAESEVPIEANDHHNKRGNCSRCGKNKSSIRRQVEKMRLQLANAQMSEADIKNELKAFLSYLEARTTSIDLSETESSLSGVNVTQVEPELDYLDDDVGINVYASCSDDSQMNHDSRFINLDDYQTLGELECLSVKQLKEVLMLHRVDYKGCCEKQELLERVERLWRHRQSVPAVGKLQTDELCKICMDAPIECVILECGHIATCTNCGKVLSECPICRQYIVRIVRFFRA